MSGESSLLLMSCLLDFFKKHNAPATRAFVVQSFVRDSRIIHIIEALTFITPGLHSDFSEIDVCCHTQHMGIFFTGKGIRSAATLCKEKIRHARDKVLIMI